MVQIKGIREGILVSLSDGEWPAVSDELYQEIEKQGDFLVGAKLILNVENHVLNAATLGKLRDDLSDKGLSLWAVIGHSDTTQMNAQALGLATQIHEPQPEHQAKRPPAEIGTDAGILIKRTLRSGTSIEHAGHITIIGDVNPGAEIIAGGDIVVWGRLAGLAHAGAEGDENAVVCALILAPTQLRIGTHIAIPPQEIAERKPEIASVREEKVIVEAWN